MPVFANSVNAQTTTPEYQPTYIPIYNTPTPPGYISYDCPGYQPIGYGVVTPSWEWWLNCGQCITPGSGYAFPTFVIPTIDPTLGFSTSTPLSPTRTPIPTDTATPTPNPNDKSAYTTVNHTYLGWLDEEVFYNWQDLDKSYSTDLNPGIYIHNTQEGTFSLNFHFTYEISNNAWGTSAYTTQYGVAFSCPYTDCELEFIDGFNEGNNIYIEKGVPQTLILGSGVANQPFYLDGFFEVNITIPVNSTVSYAKLSMNPNYIGSFLGTNVDKYHNYYWIKGLGEITPEPTPTPIPGYCSIIEDENTTTDEEEFTIPGIVVGDATCLTLGGWTVPLEWLENIFPGSFADWTMQGIQFCFAPLEFGDLTIFGVNIDLDFIAAAMAGILLIRVLTRS